MSLVIWTVVSLLLARLSNAGRHMGSDFGEQNHQIVNVGLERPRSFTPPFMTLHHPEQSQHHRDYRCKLGDCGWVKICYDTYVGKICYNIFCECKNLDKPESQGEDAGRHDSKVSLHLTIDSFQPFLAVDELGRDSRCKEDECGYIKKCENTPLGKICWNIYCFCHHRHDDIVPRLSISEIISASMNRDPACKPEQCGWQPGCTNLDELACHPFFCACNTSIATGCHAPIESDLVSLLEDIERDSMVVVNPESEADIEAFACKAECGWVERCKHAVNISLCWPMRCATGCDDDAHPGHASFNFVSCRAQLNSMSEHQK